MSYPYIGPGSILAETDRCHVTSPATLRDWLTRTFPQNYRGEITLTYVVLPSGELWVAERHSEHVSCARGLPVLAAGELTLEGLTVVEVSNLSTGYCPAPECWPAVESVLDALGLERPATFTQSFIFRCCPSCHQRQIVHDDNFTCCFCGGPL